MTWPKEPYRHGLSARRIRSARGREIDRIAVFKNNGLDKNILVNEIISQQTDTIMKLLGDDPLDFTERATYLNLYPKEEGFIGVGPIVEGDVAETRIRRRILKNAYEGILHSHPPGYDAFSVGDIMQIYKEGGGYDFIGFVYNDPPKSGYDEEIGEYFVVEPQPPTLKLITTELLKKYPTPKDLSRAMTEERYRRGRGAVLQDELLKPLIRPFVITQKVEP